MMEAEGGSAMQTLLTVAGIVGLALMAGCAPAPLTKADVEGRIVCNVDQMDQVEARREARSEASALGDLSARNPARRNPRAAQAACVELP